MLHIWTCYLPVPALKLAELTAGVSQVVLIVGFGFLVAKTWVPTLPMLLGWIVYFGTMCYFQRRLASGLPLRYSSLRHWRSSPNNFRRTSKFKANLFVKKAPTGVQATASERERLTGDHPVAVITGGERGIGFEVARQLALEGFDLILCCPFRNETEAAMVKISRLQLKSAPAMRFVELNLAEEDSVRVAAATILTLTTRIDLLINNAGILTTPVRRTNRRGDELVLAINFLGPALLTELLLERIKSSGPARIVSVSSLMEVNANIPDGYSPLTVMMESCSPKPWITTGNYSLSKLLIACYTRDLARRLEGTEVTTVALHPGVVFTAIYAGWGVWATAMRYVLRTVFKFPGEGAEVVLYCALADDVKAGGFYADCHLADYILSPWALDAKHNAKVRAFVEEHFGLTDSQTLLTSNS